jgi:threonine synthase
MMDIACTICDRSYLQYGLPYLCPHCGGLYDFRNPSHFDPALVDRSKPGIWRYSHTFGLPSDFAPLSLGEGNTPLLWAELYGRTIAFKCEYQNPSGSFKDRGSAVIAAWLQLRNVHEAVEDSSGNAGASFAAYAARAGIKARIFVPESAGGPKRRQIEAYGAELVRVPGGRKDASDAAKIAIKEGVAYASHAYLPFNLPGYATVAYEIFEQLGNKMPGAVILPAGQGGLLLGVSRGLDSLHIAMNIADEKSIIIGVQARECAPLWAAFTKGKEAERLVVENQTLAEGVRVSSPVRAEGVLRAVLASQGTICVVGENEIIPCRTALAKLGLYVEPTSAIVLSALEQTIRNIPDPVVVILTGSGYKYDLN